jgi:hypothetical protein
MVLLKTGMEGIDIPEIDHAVQYERRGASASKCEVVSISSGDIRGSV